MKNNEIQGKLFLELMQLLSKLEQYHKYNRKECSAHLEMLILKKKSEMLHAGVIFFDTVIRIAYPGGDTKILTKFMEEFDKAAEKELLLVCKSHDFDVTNTYCFYTNSNSVDKVASLIEAVFLTSKIEGEYIETLSMESWFVPQMIINKSFPS